MKYKTLKFGKCYINNDGSFIVCPIKGNRHNGYTFLASHVHPNVILGRIHLATRIIDNDKTWKEINPSMFNIISALHITGYSVRNIEKNPVIFKYN